MSKPIVTQDFVKGVDFTGAITGTAAQHNQLVEQAYPYTDGADEQQGIAFIITTTDTALGIPAVPDPTQSASFNKWKRYLWNRRPYNTATTFVPQVYMWIDAATNNATYKHWILVDPSSYITAGGGAGTPLQAAIDSINTNATNAIIAATNAGTDISAIKTAIGYSSIGSTNLQTQISYVNNVATAATVNNIALFLAISGSSNSTSGSGGLNGQIAALQAALSAGLTAAQNVSNLLPPPTGLNGSMLRYNSGLSSPAVEFFNPADTASEVILVTGTAAGSTTFAVGTHSITFDAAKNLSPGTYLVTGFISGSFGNNSGVGALSFNVLAAAVSVASQTVGSNTGSGSNFPVSVPLQGLLVVTKAMGSSAVTATITVATTSGAPVFTALGLFFSAIFKRISLPQA